MDTRPIIADLAIRFVTRLPALVSDCREGRTSHACTMLRRAGDLIDWNCDAVLEIIGPASDRDLALALAFTAAYEARLDRA